MYNSDPPWHKPVQLIGIGLAIGLGVIYYVMTRTGPVVPAPGLTITPTGFVSIEIRNTAVVLQPSPPGEGVPAPDFTLPTFDPFVTVSLSQFQGQPILINFWASWCAPCRAETPELERVYEANQQNGLVVLGINTTADDTREGAQAFVNEMKLTYPILLDETDQVSQTYSIRGLPTTIFVSRTGQIKRIFIGGLTGDQIDTFIGEIIK